jgi:hypothetical protein
MANSNLDYWMGKAPISAQLEYFYYDESGLTAIRIGSSKITIGVKKDNSWFNSKTYPSVPYPAATTIRLDKHETHSIKKAVEAAIKIWKSFHANH